MAIENARLHTAARRRGEELAALLRSSRTILGRLDLRQSLDRIVAEAAHIARTPHVKILLADEAKGVLAVAATSGEPVPPGFQVPLGQSYSGTVAATGAPLYIADTQNDPRNLLRERDRSAGIRTFLGLPITRRDRVLGVLTLNTETPRVYSDEDMAYLASFADHAAIAIENARLYEAARAELADRQRADAALMVRTRELEAIRALSVEITRELNLSRLLALLIERLGELIGGGVASIHLWDAQAQCLNARVSKAADPWRRQLLMRLGEGVSGTVALRREGLIVNDFRSSAYFTPFHAQHSRHTAVMAEPLVYRDRLLGVITLDNEGNDRRFTEEDQRVLRLFADHAAIAIENARLFQQEQQRREQLKALQAVSEEITRELDTSRLLTLLAGRVLELAGGSSGSIWLWDEAAGVLRTAIWHGLGEWMRGRTLRVGEGIPGTVAAARRGMIFNDYRSSPHAHPLVLANTNVTAIVAEPLLYRDRLVGVITVNNSAETERRFTPDDQDLLRLFAAQAAIAIENARLFEELRQSLTRLEQTQEEMVRSEKLRALGQMSAGIAHDLNNMLATILGQAELLRLRMPDPAIRESLVTLETAATDGAHVVRRLQDFARQRGHPSLGPVDLASIVAETVEITRPRWQDDAVRRGAPIRMDVALGAPLPVLGYAPEIREALTNLIFNAVDAMPNGGTLRFVGHLTDWPSRPLASGDASATAPTRRPLDQLTGCVELAVSDNGIGMPEDVRRRVFDPFFTTKGLGGTGLGLSVVYGIMERHGGRIEVESTPGRGTTFNLQFQAVDAAQGPSHAPPARQAVSARRLLVIDDEDAVRQTLAQLLLTAGHQVLEAPSGAVGLRALDQAPVDCVLTDLGMPEMVGWEVARRIKARRPDLPVVLLTGWGEQVAGGAGAEDDSVVDRIVGKPVRLEELLAVIAELTSTPGRAPIPNGPA